MKEKTGKKSILFRNLMYCLMLLVCVICLPWQVQAAGKKGWQEKNGYRYYYNEQGEKASGLTVIGKKTYYFNICLKKKLMRILGCGKVRFSVNQDSVILSGPNSR